ncbi:hypothetical protein JOM56_005108, partial [Amanita muscaria]
GHLSGLRGTGELEWTYEEYDDVFGSDSCDLSNRKIWGTRQGKERFELALADRLLDHRISQQYTP